MLVSLSADAQKLTIQKTEIDMGTVVYNTPATAVFELRNKGLRKLKIEQVDTGCGCMKAEYPNGDIGMGEKFQIRVIFDARQLGHFQRMIKVKSNGLKDDLWLTIKGVVKTSLDDYSNIYPYGIGDLLLDNNTLEFDDINKGKTYEQTIHVMNNGKNVMQPNMMHLPPYLTAYCVPDRLQPRHAGEIKVTLNPSKLSDFGLTQTSIYLAQQLGEKVSPDKEIVVSAVVLPSFDGLSDTDRVNAPKISLSSEIVNIGFAGKKKRTEEIIVTNEGRSELRISSLQMFTGGFTMTLGKKNLQPGEATKLKVTAFADQMSKVKGQPRVLMITNDPTKPKVVISVLTH